MCGGLGLLPRTGDAAVAVERERDLRALDPQGSACEAPVTDTGGERVRALERGRDVRLGLAPLGLAVGEPRIAADDGTVEAWLADRRHLHRDAEPVLVRPQAAAIVGELTYVDGCAGGGTKPGTFAMWRGRRTESVVSR